MVGACKEGAAGALWSRIRPEVAVMLWSLFLLLACSETPLPDREPDAAAPMPAVAAPTPAAASEAPADDLARVVALALACAPPEAAEPIYVAARPSVGATWEVLLSADVAVAVDPVASTCDGVPVAVAPSASTRSLSALVDTCWRAAQETRDGLGVLGSPLRAEPTISWQRGADVATVSFPEARADGIPRGLDLAAELWRDRCAPTIMD